jgi:hypothetical protein
MYGKINAPLQDTEMIKSPQEIRNELDQQHQSRLDQTALHEIEQRTRSQNIGLITSH